MRGIKRDLQKLSNSLEEKLGFSLGGELAIGVYISLFLVWNLAGASFFSPSGWAPYTEANAAAAAGSAWIEGAELHWADGSVEYRIDSSESVVETTSPGGSSGALWIEGSNIHWIDENGDERYYSAGDTGNNPSAPNGAAWMDNGVFHFIDENGNERWTSSWREIFAEGNLNEWSVDSSNFQIKTNAVYSGSYSAGAEVTDGQTNMGSVSPNPLSTERQVDKISFRYRETSSSHGGGIGFYDSGGNIVAGYATDNPQWVVWDGGSWNQIYNGDGYGRWVEVTYTFDWANGQYDYRIRDPSSGIIRTGTASLGNTNGIQTLYVKNDHSFDGTSSFTTQSASNFYMWFDAINVEW